MLVRDFAAAELEAVWQLLRDNGWAHRLGGPAELARLVAASQRTAVALDEQDRVLGFARAITDGLSNGYLSMVVVAPSHRRQGLGTQLVQHLIGGDDSITWVLRAGRDGAEAFFGRLGFRASALAMERPRAPA
jgi:GNAT superfamily N-acetyltransferase